MANLADLRAQITAGDYRVDATSVASALLNHADTAEPSPARSPGKHVQPRHGGAPPGRAQPPGSME